MTDYKLCYKCQRTLPVSSFHKSTRDGYQARCRECCRANLAENNAIAKQWRDSHPERLREKNRRYKQEQRHKIRAQRKVYKAVRRGNLRPAREFPCVKCGKPASHYHHDSYDRPLDVTPVCARCHKLIHLELI